MKTAEDILNKNMRSYDAYIPDYSEEKTMVLAAMEEYAAQYKNQSQPTEKEQDTTDWHYQFRELSKSHVAQANLIHNLKCQLSDFLESSTKRETGTHPGRKKSKRKS